MSINRCEDLEGYSRELPNGRAHSVAELTHTLLVFFQCQSVIPYQSFLSTRGYLFQDVLHSPLVSMTQIAMDLFPGGINQSQIIANTPLQIGYNTLGALALLLLSVQSQLQTSTVSHRGMEHMLDRTDTCVQRHQPMLFLHQALARSPSKRVTTLPDVVAAKPASCKIATSTLSSCTHACLLSTVQTSHDVCRQHSILKEQYERRAQPSWYIQVL